MERKLQMMDLFEYIIASWTRCNYDRKKRYHIDFDFTKTEEPYIFTIQMWSSEQVVKIICENMETEKHSQIVFTYTTCLDYINQFGIEKFLENHKKMLINIIKE